jgi:hypothetical protein
VRSVIVTMSLLLVLILIALSLSLFDYFTQIRVRFINMIQSSDSVAITYNKSLLPYSLSYGVSSDYRFLGKGRKSIKLTVETAQGETFDLDISGLSPNSLNTIILTEGNAALNYLLTESSPDPLHNEAAIRFVNFCKSDSLALELLRDNQEIERFELEHSVVQNYVALEEGGYHISISNDRRFLFSVYAEAGERYTGLIYNCGETEDRIELRLFVDNKPGDQYINLMALPEIE